MQFQTLPSIRLTDWRFFSFHIGERKNVQQMINLFGSYLIHYGILLKVDIFLCKTTNLSIYKKKNKLLGIFLISARLIDVKKMLAGKKRGGV